MKNRNDVSRRLFTVSWWEFILGFGLFIVSSILFLGYGYIHIGIAVGSSTLILLAIQIQYLSKSEALSNMQRIILLLIIHGTLGGAYIVLLLHGVFWTQHVS